MIHTYYNPTTDRYYVTTYHNGDIDTVARLQDAKKWDMGDYISAGNFKRFHAKNYERLKSKGFILKEVES